MLGSGVGDILVADGVPVHGGVVVRRVVVAGVYVYTKDAAEGIQERDSLKTQAPDVGEDNLLRLFGSEHGL